MAVYSRMELLSAAELYRRVAAGSSRPAVAHLLMDWARRYELIAADIDCAPLDTPAPPAAGAAVDGKPVEQAKR